MRSFNVSDLPENLYADGIGWIRTAEFIAKVNRAAWVRVNSAAADRYKETDLDSCLPWIERSILEA